MAYNIYTCLYLKNGRINLKLVETDACGGGGGGCYGGKLDFSACHAHVFFGTIYMF